MRENFFKKITRSHLVKISFILFISIILSACPSNQQKLKQKNIVDESLNLSQTLKKIETDTVLNYKKEPEEQDFNKPETKPIEIINSSLPDFTVYKNVKQKKRAFFSFLMPLIQNENNSILKQRAFIKEQYQIFNSIDSLRIEDLALLNKYIKDYRCRNTDLNESKTYDELLIRVDIIPQELALVQAALESSWGSSYFAKVANNLYGQWCFKPGCGVVPRARRKGETHEVAKFKTLALGIKSYMLLLNSHPSFSLLREERIHKRVQKEKPEAVTMANGLKAYSARGDAYIKDVKSMIRTNKEFFIEAHKEENVLTISILEQKQSSN